MINKDTIRAMEQYASAIEMIVDAACRGTGVAVRLSCTVPLDVNHSHSYNHNPSNEHGNSHARMLSSHGITADEVMAFVLSRCGAV